MECKDTNFNLCIVNTLQENLNVDIVTFESITNILDKKALELSVDIFEDPICTKYHDVGEAQYNVLSNQKFEDLKNLVFDQNSKIIKSTFNDMHISKEVLNDNDLYSKHFFRCKDINHINALSKTKKIQNDTTSVLKPPIIPLGCANTNRKFRFFVDLVMLIWIEINSNLLILLENC